MRTAITTEAYRMKEEDEEYQEEGEIFERLLSESMMRLCVDQCRPPKIKVSNTTPTSELLCSRYAECITLS